MPTPIQSTIAFCSGSPTEPQGDLEIFGAMTLSSLFPLPGFEDYPCEAFDGIIERTLMDNAAYSKYNEYSNASIKALDCIANLAINALAKKADVTVISPENTQALRNSERVYIVWMNDPEPFVHVIGQDALDVTCDSIAVIANKLKVHDINTLKEYSVVQPTGTAIGDVKLCCHCVAYSPLASKCYDTDSDKTDCCADDAACPCWEPDSMFCNPVSIFDKH